MREPHYFLALWPDRPLAQEIERRCRHHLEPAWGARPVTPPNYHLTLAFLGRLLPGAVTSVIAYVDTLEPGRFDLALDRMGGFARSRTLYFAPSTSPVVLTGLAETLRRGLAEAGLHHRLAGPATPDPFVPHVTLARGVRRWPGARPVPLLVWPVQRLCLARSEPGRDYEICFEWQLSGLEDPAECGIIMG